MTQVARMFTLWGEKTLCRDCAVKRGIISASEPGTLLEAVVDLRERLAFYEGSCEGCDAARWVSIDWGLEHTGWATWDGSALMGCGTLRTKADKPVKGPRGGRHRARSKADERAERAGHLWDQLVGVLGATEWSLAVVESPVTPPRCNDLVATGLAWGVVACAMRASAVPVSHIDPQEVRKRLGFRKGDAGKEDSEALARELVPARIASLPEWARQHACDAVCIGLAWSQGSRDSPASEESKDHPKSSSRRRSKQPSQTLR